MQAQKNSSGGNSCPGTFSQDNVVDHHSGIHSGEKAHKCNICQKTFARKHTLVRHARIHTGEKPYNCNICHKTFISSSHMRCHVRTHTGEKPYKCTICQKTFARSDTRVRHVRKHTGEKPYKCNICQKTYAGKISLENHTVTQHIRPYKCNICQKTYAGKISLENHTLTQHTRPYKCNICQKTFTENISLNNHTLTHYTRPYILCFVPISQKSDLDLHRKDYTGEKPFPCIVNCEIPVISCDRNLKRHITGCKEDNSCRCISGQNIVSTKECQRATIKSDDRLTERGNSLDEKDLSPTEATGKHKTSSLQSLTQVSDEKQLSEDLWCDFSRFTLRPYGCGMCDEMFEIEKEFMDHCFHHSINDRGKDTFSELFPMRLLSYIP